MGSGHAVVIGASMGGLLAARALSDSFAQVSVLDRDPLTAVPVHRRGVPQGRQLHVLLARGRAVLEELFPGISAQLAAEGVPTVDLHEQVLWFNEGFPLRRAPSSLLGLGVSRPLLEHVVRSRVAALDNVRLLPGHEVLGLSQADGRVNGVRVHHGRELLLPADLVVDAAGRGSRSPLWLTQMGYRPAPEEKVHVDVTYVTRLYRRRPDSLDGLLGTLSNATVDNRRAGIVAVQEQDRFAVVLSGILGEEPPITDEGFVRYAASLAGPHIGRFVRESEPLSQPVRMRFPASVRRRYERLRRFPDGYLVVADALCSFNPIYGQGMTVAALQAQLLGMLCREGGQGLARRFFSRAARVIDGPWTVAVTNDLRFEEVPGRRTARVRATNAYIRRVNAAASGDTAVGAAFLRVLNLVDPPSRLLRPSMLLRVARGALRGP